MTAKRVLIFLCLFGLVCGCAGHAKRINDVSLGMTKDEVIDVMGSPAYTSVTKDVEILSYHLRSGGVFSDTFFVRLKDGSVDRFGRRGDFGYFY
jgi:hypothetical protein